MSYSETTKKFQKLSKRLLLIGFALAIVVCAVMFIVVGVLLNNKNKSTANGMCKEITIAIIVACFLVTVIIGALFIMCFLMNKIYLKLLEEANAAEEEAHRVKSDFLTNTSHGIRTPLNTIMGLTSIALANIDDTEQVENCLKKISVSSRNLLERINDVSETSEPGNASMQFADGDAPAQSAELDLKGKRILVAEDNDLNWEIAELLLTGEGLEVEHAENGQTCVDMLLAHKPGYYDAILMDVRMPVMSGLEATAVIRRLNKKVYNRIPIIAMTADAFAEDMQKCLDCGMNAHIAKPIDIEVVKATLAKFIVDKE